jgi:hypothetical protein
VFSQVVRQVDLIALTWQESPIVNQAVAMTQVQSVKTYLKKGVRLYRKSKVYLYYLLDTYWLLVSTH